MKFDIGKGGMFAIVVGLLALSGGVFALGLVAGYEMAKQNQADQNQVSTAFPLPSPPEGEAASAPEPALSHVPSRSPERSEGTGEGLGVGSHAAANASSPAPVSPPKVASASPPPAPPVHPPGPPPLPLNHGPAIPLAKESPAAAPITKAPPAVASRTKPPEIAPPPSRPPLPPPAEASSAAPPPAPKPYNIQIEAVMDKTGANAMVARLKSLGYNAHAIKTVLGGDTWYRVQVGPYDSEAEARAAQAKLREQYKQHFTATP